MKYKSIILSFFAFLLFIALTLKVLAGDEADTKNCQMDPDTVQELSKKGEALTKKFDFERFSEVMSHHFRKEYLLSVQELKNHGHIGFIKGVWIFSVSEYTVADKSFWISGCTGQGFEIVISPFLFDQNMKKAPYKEKKAILRTLAGHYFPDSLLKTEIDKGYAGSFEPTDIPLEGQDSKGAWKLSLDPIWDKKNGVKSETEFCLGYRWTRKARTMDLRALLEVPEFIKNEKIITEMRKKAEANLDIEKIHHILAEHIKGNWLLPKEELSSYIQPLEYNYDSGIWGYEKPLPSAEEFFKRNPFHLDIEYKKENKLFIIGIRAGFGSADMIWIKVTPFIEQFPNDSSQDRMLISRDLKKMAQMYLVHDPPEGLLSKDKYDIGYEWGKDKQKFRIWADNEHGKFITLHYTCLYTSGTFGNHLESLQKAPQ